MASEHSVKWKEAAELEYNSFVDRGGSRAGIWGGDHLTHFIIVSCEEFLKVHMQRNFRMCFFAENCKFNLSDA